jgi:hypothetical protein
MNQVMLDEEIVNRMIEEAVTKRTWVGLTEDEAIELLPEGEWEIESTLEFAKAIEAALMERNK